MYARAKAETIQRIPGTDNYRVAIEVPRERGQQPLPLVIEIDVPSRVISHQIDTDGYCRINLSRITVKRRRRKFSLLEKHELYKGQGERCGICGRHFLFPTWRLTTCILGASEEPTIGETWEFSAARRETVAISERVTDY